MAIRKAVLDVRPLPHGEKHGRVFASFDALAPGEAFVLVSDHEPRGLLAELQARRARTFEWNVLESGPERFRIEIERREEATPRAVTEFLARDHDRLDALLAAAQDRATKGSAAEARSPFEEFASGLVRHIQMEENALFPAFEQATGLAQGPTTVMRGEHRQIGRLIEEGKTALEKGDASRLAAVIGDLAQLLGAHNQKEEGVLYPMMDRTLRAERDRDELVRALQAQTTQGGCGCCSHGESAPPAARGRRLEVS